MSSDALAEAVVPAVPVLVPPCGGEAAGAAVLPHAAARTPQAARIAQRVSGIRCRADAGRSCDLIAIGR
jgi:hypothetical protein